MTASKTGEQVLKLIIRGVDTEQALENATGKTPGEIARTLGALSRRKLIVRYSRDGEMRWKVTED